MSQLHRHFRLDVLQKRSETMSLCGIVERGKLEAKKNGRIEPPGNLCRREASCSGWRK
jgi:hypothetical protein